jgi:hypothetical protein
MWADAADDLEGVIRRRELGGAEAAGNWRSLSGWRDQM